MRNNHKIPILSQDRLKYRKSMQTAVKSLIKTLIRQLLPMNLKVQLGSFLLNNGLADGDDNPDLNGEYKLIDDACFAYSNSGCSELILLDVGANIGEWAIKATRSSPAGSIIYSFEPCSTTYQSLLRSFDVTIQQNYFADHEIKY